MLGFGREGCSGNTHLDPNGKQVLEKCLSVKPQSERAASLLNVDFTTAYSRSIFNPIAASPRR